MLKIRYIQVGFEHPIDPWEVVGFRGAVIKIAGTEHSLFHNHLKNGLRYGYPLIQYKRVDKRPLLISIDQGIDQVHHFFENLQEGILLGNRPYNLVVRDLNMQQYTMQVWDKSFDYRIENWLALNEMNFDKFTQMSGVLDRTEMLTQILTGNILSMAKGIGWLVEKPIEVKITKLYEPRMISFKQTKMLAFNLHFQSNVFLPRYIGLGKGASSSFGIVHHQKNNN
jgi:hypothetical protein